MTIAADRFASLLDLAPPAVRRGARPSAAAPVFKPAARLLVRDGLHHGAWMSLRGERLCVGSADDGDIVLTDAGMPARAGHFVLGRQGWQFETADAADAGEATPSAAPPAATAAGESLHGRWRRRRWQLHGVTLVVIDAAPPALPQAPAGMPRRLVLKVSLGAGAALLAVVALVAMARIAAPSPQARIAQALPSLLTMKLPDVRLRTGDDGAIELIGHVADAAQFERLRAWLQDSRVDDARLRVQVGSALTAQVREALGNAADAKVSYTGGGHVRVEGSTRSAELKRRVQALVAELREAAAIDDQLALVEGKDATPVQRALPIRIVNVMLGGAPYFQTDTGATYFIGSKLPDGAEVMSIAAMQIVFRLDQRDVIYRLDN